MSVYLVVSKKLLIFVENLQKTKVMKMIEKILEDYKQGITTLEVAQEQIVDLRRIVSCPSSDKRYKHEVKYLQWQDTWYCCTCRDIIGKTEDLLNYYENK